MAKRILHIDMDCFYAAIEIRGRPDLAKKPVAVGGDRDRRGVITTCNYVARRFGVRSAMPTFIALQKCPDLIVLPVRFEIYREESRRIRAIFRNYTPIVEPLSLDEAYLDITALDHPGGEVAAEIRKRILETTGLTASAGVGPNKLIAKIASDWNKPDGQFEVAPHEIPSFMAHLPARRVWGIGPVAAARLERLGIRTCGDLQNRDPRELVRLFGKFGWELHELCRGIDRREVEPYRIRKSLSVERTFERDLNGLEECLSALAGIHAELRDDLCERAPERPIEKLFIKIKFADFSNTSVERGGGEPCLTAYESLLAEGLHRGRRPVRLIGAGVRFTEPGPVQLELDLSITSAPGIYA